jgi:hypothetical protein
VRGGDLTLECRIEQVVPRCRGIHTQLAQNALVGAEAQDPDVDAGPLVVGILVLVGDLGGVRGVVGLDEALGGGGAVPVGRATVPDVELRGVLRRVQTGDGLPGGQSYVGGLDAGLLSEGLGPLLAQVLHGAAGDGDRLTLRLVDGTTGQGQSARGGDGEQSGE